MAAETEREGALGALFWRSEILQALFWMQGEGLGSESDVETLSRLLAAAPAAVLPRLEQLVQDGYLEALPGAGEGRFRLTPLGREEGGRSFQDEFADLTRPAHGECAPGCWCHDPDHAGEACPTHGDVPHGHVHG